MRRGVTWKTGKVFNGTREVYQFDLLPEEGHERPAFINLQQFLFEAACVARAEESGLRRSALGARGHGVEAPPTALSLEIATPDGAYKLTADWLIAADGGTSTVRRALGLGFRARRSTTSS